MATFKAVVQQHQQRRDGSYPVSIRVTNNRKSFYIPTGLYCYQSQINRKTFEIKDQFILSRVVSTIREYQQRLLSVSSSNLSEMSSDDLKKLLTTSPNAIDFLGFCQELVDQDSLRWNGLKQCIKHIHDMGIENMSVMDFTSSFIAKFREYIDNTQFPIISHGKIVRYQKYTNNTKNHYMTDLCMVFRMLQRKYNSEFNKIIYHDPLIGFKNYVIGPTKRRSMSAERVSSFFSIEPHTKNQEMVIDLMKLSFCLCGMNLMDIFSLPKTAFNPDTMRITYERHKTRGRRADNALTSVHIEPEIEPLLHKYMAPKDSPFLFKFGTYKAHIDDSRHVNNRMASLCRCFKIERVSPYTFRHSWATIARNDCDISKDDIDLCLVHAGQNPMADAYIRPDWSRIDKANRKVLDFVFHSNLKSTNSQ